MKATELRIGNLVTQNGFLGYVYSIKSAEPRVNKRYSDKEIITLFDNGLTVVTIEDIKPIPLTEEWLLNFGFELINNEFFKSRNSEICLFWTVNKNKMIPEYNEKRLITGYDFKYFHQLQNLYFALTGEELTL